MFCFTKQHFVNPAAVYFNNWTSYLITIPFNYRVRTVLITFLACCRAPGPFDHLGTWAKEKNDQVKRMIREKI